MKFLVFLSAIALSIIWIVIFNSPNEKIPALGKFFDPITGFWANANSANEGAQSFFLPEEDLQKQVEISFDERMIPHIEAENDEDLFYAQGFLHAFYRLWQMDMQARIASGRLSEVVGKNMLEFDREQRRKGMVWAAENSLSAMETNSETKKILDAYTKGVNAFIHNMRYENYPLEYKLMSFEPEPWTNLKTALILKLMADDLTGKTDDIALSYLRNSLSSYELDFLFPERISNSIPVIDKSSYSNSQSQAPFPLQIVFSDFTIKDKDKNAGINTSSPTGIGSNNWAITGEKSKNNTAILSNDPHLGLNLPSIWYEMQLSSQSLNCYGVSIPGTPSIIIGFNDSLSWGFTNNYRDVKDFYELVIDEDYRLYQMDKKWVPFNFRMEEIKIKNEKPFIDTMRYSVHGPVQYDINFKEPSGSEKTLAVTWMAHQPTNELYALYQMNKAENLHQFKEAIYHFESPAQNFIYADRLGNIGIYGQGKFINKWKDQGRFVMRGDISTTLWGKSIPMNENPFIENPSDGYLASANNIVTGKDYPYWYNGNFTEFRSWEINELLNDTLSLSIYDMMKFQTSNWSYLAEKIAPLFYHYGANWKSIPENDEYLKNWNYHLDSESKTATAFQIWWHFLYQNIWEDEFENLPAVIYPSPERTMQLLLSDTSSKYYDDVRTPEKETLADIAAISFRQTWDSIRILEQKDGTEWYKVKNTSLTHLGKIKAFSYNKIKTGGWSNTLNAMTATHGPSWRMVVEMAPEGIVAYANYPGGQSGNPGSKFYSQFIEDWAAGKYYKIQFNERKMPVKKPFKE